MLSRRHLRVKVLQALYAYFQSGGVRIDQGENQLVLSINKLYELFIHQLSFLVELARFTENRLEENKRKHLPTAEDLNPNLRFVQNSIIQLISENKEFRKMENLYKINWANEQDMLRKFYNQLKDTEAFGRYMGSTTVSFEADKKILQFVVEEMFTDFELLQFYYEEKSIFFADDYHLVTYLLINYFRFFDKKFNQDTPLPTIIKTEKDEVNEDLIFVKELFRRTVYKAEEWDKVIASSTSNWELERIAIMDVIILRMALTELTEFNSIPVKVTLNEYIDISKYFSTPKSKVFVNGILDKLIADFKESGRIKKSGRGLHDG